MPDQRGAAQRGRDGLSDNGKIMEPNRESSARQGGTRAINIDNAVLVPEEHYYRPRKRLIFHTNMQREITDTINSTNTSSSKGRMSQDGNKKCRPRAA